jgi:multiple sugar transport system permease protein
MSWLPEPSNPTSWLLIVPGRLRSAADSTREDRGLGGAGGAHTEHTVSVLLDDPHGFLYIDCVVQRSRVVAARRFHHRAFKRVLGLSTPEEARAEGGSGASVDFVLYLRNSLIFAIVATAGQVFFSALAAYAFARLKWPGRNIVFTLFLTALMVPPIFTALPNFILMRSLGLINTFPGLILPYFFMTPFAIFFLRQFFLGISVEIEEAARLDGAGHARIFFQIILPMSSAPIVTLSILTFINMWNEYLWPLLIGNNEGTRVLTVALGVFRTQTPAGSPDWAGLMAATLVAALPLLIIFLLFAKRVVNNIGFSGMK